ncbi:MAG: hypothetical protein Q7S69_04935 [Nitrosomonadaceae bacterium]|nr:hypothetical protein [Nitrosomonadaceae bacterium]
MNILMLADESDTRQLLNKLLVKTEHHLTRRKLDDGVLEIYLDDYDMVLVDGNVCGCTQQANLLSWIREARRRYPHLPVAVMNCVGSQVSSENRRAGGETSHSCGVSESADGAWSMRCRLQELALSETAALMRDVCERPLLEPVVFEYSGRE